ncbi:hypothetical protein M123_3485 [Bacteroides fragilis str. 3976T8]|uniref:Uncharacterized protein n=1 Tax=Bacteroides fragilis str. 3976T8 TaxID=1339314 RepID=A0A016CKI2_BACFG|nr:hypothetical protein M123_3485 [Bacteroides fragilis str. 3976T8]
MPGIAARLDERKYRSEAKMIFFQPTQPLKGATLRNQPGKRLSLQQEMKKQTSDSLF